MTTKQNVQIVSVTFPPPLLAEMDDWATKLGVARSELIRSAVNYYIADFLIKRRFNANG